MAGCISSLRFNMKADVLHQSGNVAPPPEEQLGEWVEQQDPITGDIVRVWVPTETTDDPSTPSDETKVFTVPCIVRGIVEGGVRAAGTTEDWGELYESIEIARMWFPAGKVITKRDRIVNIRNNRGVVLWKEEEADSGVVTATVFEVLGVTPIIDPFGNHIENYALLERTDIQEGAPA